MDPRQQLEVAEVLGLGHDPLQRVERIVGRQEAVAGSSATELDLDAAAAAERGSPVRPPGPPSASVDQPGGPVERPVCLLDRVLLDRVLAAGREIVDRLLRVAGLLEVHREHGRELAGAIRVQLLERLADPAVQFAALLLEERAVGRVLDERVPEQVLELRPLDGEPDEALRRRARRAAHRAPGALVIVPSWHRLRLADDALQHAHGELAPDHRRDPEAALRVVRAAGRSGPAAARAASRGSRRRRPRPWPPSDCRRARSTPRSISIRTTSSTKNGLPSARAMIRSRDASGSDSISSRLETRLRLSASVSGSSRISVSASPNSSRACADERPAGASPSRRAARRRTGWAAGMRAA